MTRVDINGVGVEGWELTGGWIAVIIVAAVVFFAVFVWGIVAAAKTKDVGVQAGKLLLHLFIWGGFVAAIVYAIKASGNRDANFTQQQLTPYPKQEEPTKDELLKRIEELEKKNKK